MSQSKQEPVLREISVNAMTVEAEDELDELLSGNNLKQTSEESEQQIIDRLANTLLDDGDDWFAEYDKAIAETTNATPDNISANVSNNISNNSSANVSATLMAERDQLRQELEALRSQHQFECEYVDQLEQEIISVTQDRDRQVAALTAQIAELMAAKNLNSTSLDSDNLEPDNLDSDNLSQLGFDEFDEFGSGEYQPELIQQLQCQNTALEISQQTIMAELEATQKLLKESTQSLELAQAKISEISSQKDQIEEELIQHLSNQAKLHQSLRGLENEYVGDLTRVQELEEQIEDLQNHVLAQASKTTEYEAAIQHWKEQSVRHQHHALQLSAALERLLAERPLKHLTSVQDESMLGDVPERSPFPNAQHNPQSMPERSQRPNPKVDLPAFLVRNRS